MPPLANQPTPPSQPTNQPNCVFVLLVCFLFCFASFFKTAKAGWKNSVRHNLSLSKMFCKLNRQETEKGNYKGKFLCKDVNTGWMERSIQPSLPQPSLRRRA